MKIESNIQRTPSLESVTLTLNPREAFLLCMLIGNMHEHERLSVLNYSNYSIKPPFAKGRVECAGEATLAESKEMEKIWERISYIFNNIN